MDDFGSPRTPTAGESTSLGDHGKVSPTTSGRTCLVSIHPPDLERGLVELPVDSFTIGRASDCDLTLHDGSVSRLHAILEPLDVGHGHEVVDQGSTNGTHVNEQRVRRQVLASGDLIRIGSHVLKYLASDHIEAQYHETVYAMMVTDGLTGTYNKRFFLDSLDRELTRAFRHHRPVCLAMIDLDHFKLVNDRHGHLIGDEVLREFGQRARRLVRKDEVLARYGGEEFAIILDEASLPEATAFAERLRKAIADEPFVVDDRSLTVTISIGVAPAPRNSPISPEGLIALADARLYDAKNRGRNCVAS